jgi:hypothetical protein
MAPEKLKNPTLKTLKLSLSSIYMGVRGTVSDDDLSLATVPLLPKEYRFKYGEINTQILYVERCRH